MGYDDTTLDDALGLFTINMDLASLLMALECGEWRGTVIPEVELSPYVSASSHKDASGRSWDVWRPAHSLGSTAPSGTLADAKAALMSAMQTDIDAGRLPTVIQRSALSGRLIPHETRLLISAVERWAEVRSIELSDLWTSYVEDEQKVAEAALEAGENARKRLELAGKFSDRHDYEALPEWAKSMVLAAHPTAKSSNSQTQAEKPLTIRERGSFLSIIGSLIDTCLSTSPGGQRYSTFDSQAAIIDVLISRSTNAPGVSKRNLEKIFALARQQIGSGT